MAQAALVASHHNPILKTVADRLRAAGMPHKVVVTASTRKPVSIAWTRCEFRLEWSDQAAWKVLFLGLAKYVFAK